MSSAPPDPVLTTSRGPWSNALRRFLKNRLAVYGLIVLSLLTLFCYGLVPYYVSPQPGAGSDAPPRYAYQTLSQHLQAPALGRGVTGILGTDKLGRDLAARFVVGGALSLAIGLASACIAVFIGTTVGLISGYAGGRIDALLMRLVDILYGLPYILLVILMRVALVPWATLLLAHFTTAPATWANVLVLLVGIGAVSWLTMARVIRGQVLSLREQPFIEAARAMGCSNRRILLKHILPNLVGPILVYATLTVPNAILSESFLSFLGLGIQQPLPSWGNLAAEGTDAINPIRLYWWLILWPCAGLSIALLSLNFVGDGLRDALDPKSR